MSEILINISGTTLEALITICKILDLDYTKHDLTIDLVAKAEIALCEKYRGNVFHSFMYPVGESFIDTDKFCSTFTLNALQRHVEIYDKDECTARVKAFIRAVELLDENEIERGIACASGD